jgi:hypothetical protein
MNSLRILTIIFHLLIIIGAGHGGAPLGFFEVISLRSLFSGDFQFNISGSYDDRLITVGLASLLGQCVLVASYFFDKNIKSKLTLTGCFILLGVTFLLTKGALDVFSLEFFSLFTALPFIGTCLFLLTKEIKGLRSTKLQ